MDGAAAQLETEDADAERPRPRRCGCRVCHSRCHRLTIAILAVAALAALAVVAHWVTEPPKPLSYSEEQASRLADLAGAAYCSKASLEDWRCGAKCLGSVSKPVHVCPGDTTQAFVARYQDGCIVSFEGTKTYLSMVQDLRIAKNLSDWKTGGSVHSGFLAEWESLEPCVRTSLASACSGKELRVTGHSLGGAISSLAMVDLIQGWTIKEGYTFGMPRTGDPIFARHFDRLFFGKFFRVTHHMDPVPHVPPQDFGFQHFSSEVFYDGNVNAGFRHCTQAEDLQCAGRYWDLPLDLFHLGDHMDYMGQHTGSLGCEDKDAAAFVSLPHHVSQRHM